MYWMALQATLPAVAQFSLGNVPALVALLIAAVPGWLAARARLVGRRPPRPAQRLVLVHTVSEPHRRAA